MSTLFFDGFDRGILLKSLDPNYWTTETKIYPQYSFAGTTYLQNSVIETFHGYPFAVYSNAFQSLSIKNSKAPSGSPVVGTGPGFLALNNIPINNSDFDLTPITYLQLSGFSPISGTKSFFGLRCLGIETKDSRYVDTEIAAQRFGARHPFVAFCSGNYTGLLLSFIKISGANLLNLKMDLDSPTNFTGPKLSIGLEVLQNNSVNGIFDLNIGDTISNYRITPPYCSFDGVNGIPINTAFDVLTIADTSSNNFPSRPETTMHQKVWSRWSHFEIGIDHINNNKFIQLKLEDVDVLVVNNEEEDRNLWEVTIPISGFYYDNIKIFNRTYNSGLYPCRSASEGIDDSVILNNNYYYNNGSLFLIDDVTLIDNTGVGPRFFLGKTSKVLPLNPGGPVVADDSDNIYDGPRQWNYTSTYPWRYGATTYRSNKAILATFDGNNSTIFTPTPSLININTYSNLWATGGSPRLPDFRYYYNDAVGGLKIYNSVRKEFLDTTFSNIVYKSEYNNHDYSIRTLLHFDNNLTDSSLYNRNVNMVGESNFFTVGKFSSALKLEPNSFIVLTDSYNLDYQTYNHEDYNPQPFTLEAWIKFDNNSDEIVLFEKKYQQDISSSPFSYYEAQGYGNVFYPNNPYTISVNTGSLDIKRWFGFRENSFAPSQLCTTPAILSLPLPTSVSIGDWHHIALTRTVQQGPVLYNIPTKTSYFTVFLDGVSGIGFVAKNLSDRFNPICPGTGVEFSLTQPKIMNSPVSNLFSMTDSHFGLLISLTSSINPPIDMNPGSNFPHIYLYGQGYIDDYRISSGVVRYTRNFTPPVSSFTGIKDAFVRIGPEHLVGRTQYKTIQFYQMNRPDTGMPFSMDEVKKGFRLGVEKL